MIYLILFIIAIMICGSINIGPLSIRVYATCLMATYLLIFKSKIKLQQKVDESYIWIYLLFSFLMGIALILNGEFIEFNFTKVFLAYNFVCIIVFFAIERIVDNKNDLNKIIYTLLGIILFDDIVTILQYIGNPIGWSIGYLFGDIDKYVDRAENKDTLLGLSATPGIFGHVVKNAFYIAVITPLSFCLVNRHCKAKIKFLTCLITICSIVAIFMTQQRAGFGLMLLSVLLALGFYLKQRPFVILLFIFISIVFITFGIDLVTFDFGRLISSEDHLREKLMTEAYMFILNHPFLGGPVSFLKETGLPAHNLLLDTYIYSGLLGFIVMVILLLKTIINSIIYFFNGLKKHNKTLVYSSYAVLGCMAYGFMHNTSYLNGEIGVFILLAIMLKSETLTVNLRLEQKRKCSQFT